MDIKKDGNRFYYGDEPKNALGEITFVLHDNNLLEVNQTFTDPSLRGQGIARKLVERVAKHARDQGYKLSATCSYAHKVLSEPEYSDIFAEQ